MQSMEADTSHLIGYHKAYNKIIGLEKPRHQIPEVNRNQVCSLFETVGTGLQKVVDIVIERTLKSYEKSIEPIFCIPNINRTDALFLVTKVERRLMIGRKRDDIPLQTHWWYRTPSDNKGLCYIAIGHVGLEYLVTGDYA